MLHKDVCVLLKKNCFHALRDFLERSLRFWSIHKQLIRASLHFSMSQQICITEIIKYVQKLLLFACLVFLEPYVKRYTNSKRVLLTN